MTIKNTPKAEFISIYRAAGIDKDLFSSEALERFHTFCQDLSESIGDFKIDPWHNSEEWEEIQLEQLPFEIGVDPETGRGELMEELKKVYPLSFELQYSVLINLYI